MSLSGDHQQLRPSPTVHRLAVEYNLDVSLFERMINNGVPYERLRTQHRMRPEISRLLKPHIYEDLEDHESVFNYRNVLGVQKNVFFVTHTYHEESVSDRQFFHFYRIASNALLCHLTPRLFCLRF